MLLALRLRDFVIVDTLELEFGPGFSVLSGETGAGKSILLDALQLALGVRSDAGAVREGAARADIAAEFHSTPALDDWLAQRDLAADPGVVLLRRVVEADGRSRALINGQPATAALLREVGEQLVDIHGQHAAQSLLRADGQRLLLDAYGALLPAVQSVGAAWARVRDARRNLDEAEGHSREIALERERLEWQAGELSHLQLQEGEWEALEGEQKRLAHAASLIEGTSTAVQALSDSDGSASGTLGHVVSRLRPLAQFDARLQPALELLDSASIQLDEAVSQLASYAEHIDLDPARLAQVESRIDTVFSASRKLRIAPRAIPGALEDMRARLEKLTNAQDTDALRAQLERCTADYDVLAAALSTERGAAARRLAAGVTTLIGDLGMAGGRLVIAIEPAEPAASGRDRIELRIAGHAGATPRPLAKVASGGELSRIGLAIAVLAAQANPTPTLIFDEADAGIGGSVADVVGALMRRLGDSRQVLCVTHLPQVAAKAHQHFAVSKVTLGETTVSRVNALDRPARVEEIARMLGGQEITATTRKHARELLAQA